jgi:hypothetical protein
VRRNGENASVQPLEALEPRRLLAVTNGLNAVYFNNPSFTGASRTRIDGTVAFDWANNTSPAKGLRGTTFAARWHGLVKPPTSETYTFVTRNNDGVRLWVDGNLLIDSWEGSVRATHEGSITLTKNRLYDLRLEYFDSRKRTAAINLFWRTPTRAQSHIPSKWLFAYDTRSASIGDYGWDNEGEADVATLMRTWKPQFITTVGDNNYEHGGADTIDQNIGKYFQDFIGDYQGSYGTGSGENLFFPTLGNHDWETARAKPYLDYFALPGNERYYDFVRGSIHFFAVDSDMNEPDGTSPNSTQGQWLQSRLAASTSPFNVVYFHHSPHSSGSEGSSAHMDWPFHEWGADVVLSGHSHSYERVQLGDFTYLVNGAGGRPNGFNYGGIVQGSVVRNGSDPGALLIQANEYAMTLQYQVVGGEIVDSITLRV